MFLKEVYRHSKWMFAGMLFFILLQLVINYKKGMVFSPFYHYGMYSMVQPPRHHYYINTVTVNGDTLKGSQFSPQQWDKIYFTLQQVLLSRCDSSFYNEQVLRLYKKAGLPVPHPSFFINKNTPEELLNRYEIWLGKQLGKTNAQVDVSSNMYRFHFGRFVYQRKENILDPTLYSCR